MTLALPAADHGCPFYPSYSNSDLQPFNFDFQPSTPVGDKSLILPGYEVVSYCCPGLSRVTGFEIWNASWYSPTNDAYIAAVAALCDDGSGTPYVTSFVEPKVSGGSALSTSCDEKITSYFVEGFTALPDASDQNWIRHSLAGRPSLTRCNVLLVSPGPVALAAERRQASSSSKCNACNLLALPAHEQYESIIIDGPPHLHQ